MNALAAKWARLWPARAGTAPASAVPVVEEGFMPNFCASPLVLNVLVLAQLLAVAITVITPPLTRTPLLDLFVVSLFIHWIALVSVCALCLARSFLNSLPENRALIMAYLILLCVTWLVGECALWLLSNVEIIVSARPSWYAYFHLRNLTVSAIVNALVLRYLIARHQLQMQARSVERARAQILRQKIRPHFVFNSMNIIASLTRRSPTRAESAIEDMSDLFRVMVDDGNDLSPVHNEISIARKYLKVERLRLERRLKVNWSAPGLPRSARTPVLLLQLLLEHVVHNAVEQMSDGGVIEVKLEYEAPSMLVIELEAPYPPPPARGMIDNAGLENIRLRLNDHYGAWANMQVDTDAGRIFVRITHPAFEKDDRDAHISS